MLDKVLIASASAMFRTGILSLLKTRQDANQLEIMQADSMSETMRLINDMQPGLVVLDHDDQKIQREEFLNYFIRSQFSVMVILISLLSNGSVVVYDRINLQPEEVTEFLKHTLSTNKIPNKADLSKNMTKEKK